MWRTGDVDRGAAAAADAQHGLLDAPALGVVAVDGEDDVAGLDPGALGGVFGSGRTITT